MKRNREQMEDGGGEYLRVVQEPRPTTEPNARSLDFVFVHGLNPRSTPDFAKATWTHKNGNFWPKDQLGQIYPLSRILLFSYNSRVASEVSTNGIQQHANNLLQRLHGKRRKEAQARPIVFVAHSMGGLVVKQALIAAKNNDRYRDIQRATHGLVFFAVPHRGSHLAGLGAIAKNIVNSLTGETRNDLVESLEQNSLFQESQATFFQHQLEKYQIVSIVEDRPTKLGVIVDNKSGTLGVSTSREVLVTLDSDHSEVCRFDGDGDKFELVRDALDELVDLAFGGEPQNSTTIPVQMTPQKMEALQSLYFLEMDSRKNDIEHPFRTTCSWLSEHPSYLAWLRQTHRLLWIKGNPGAGKSTLLRYAQEDAPKDRALIISFFFHGRGALIQKSRLGLFRSLLHQILQLFPALLDSFSSIFSTRCETQGKFGEKWNWQERELRDFFESHVPKPTGSHPLRIYIDALDECGEEVAKDLVDFFERLTTSENHAGTSDISICFSCRHYPLVSLDDGLEICVEDENLQDINVYIQDRIEGRIKNTDTTSMIQTTIAKRSSGNFQWVKLVVNGILDRYKRGQSKAAAIQTYIQALPSDLSDLYKSLLQEISNEDLPHSLKLLQWVCFAIRPLSVTELRFAIVLDANMLYTSIGECQEAEEFAETDEQMEKRVIYLSKGLVEVKIHEETWTAQFIHQSVIDYLVESGFNTLDRYSTESAAGRAHFQLSRSCIRYIELREVNDLYGKGYLGYEMVEGFPFLEYAVKNWITHAVKVEREGLSQLDLSPYLLPNRMIPLWVRLYQNVHPFSSHFKGTTLLHLISIYNIFTALDNINLADVGPDSKDGNGRTPLSWAAENGHEAIVRLLVERDDVNADSKDYIGQTPLSWAAKNGHEAIIRLVVERNDVDADSKDYTGQTPLSWAAENGREAIVRLLVERDDVNADLKDNNSQTPLLWAAKNGHEAIVRLLVERDNVEADSKDYTGQTPLSWAARNGYEAIVRLLVERDDVNADSKDYIGQTPLSWAAKSGHEAIVRLVVERNDVDADSKDYTGQTPLSWAAENGREAIVRLLVERNDVDADSKDENNQTPLSWAARNGYKAIVRLLAERDDVDTDSKDKIYGRTPLSWAAENGHKATVRLLAERDDVDVDSKDENNRTPLSWAARNGREAIVRLLAERDDVDADSKDAYKSKATLLGGRI